MTVEFKIEGLENLQKNLRLLPKEVQNKGAKFAGRKAANVIRNAAIANARKIDDSKTANDIAKNIAVRFSPKIFKATGNLQFRIGVLGGAKEYAKTRKNVRSGKAGKSYKTDGSSGNPGGDTFYWRFVEFGTSRVKARPFLRPAIIENSQAATNEFSLQFNKWLDRQLKSLDKGNK
jgi:HK97 gp10 family phage protein